METVIEFVKTNWFLVIGTAAIMSYATWDYIKRKKVEKKREILRQQYEAEQIAIERERKHEAQYMNEEYEAPSVKREEIHLSNYFTDKKETSKEINMDLKDFSIQVMNEKNEVEKHIKNQADILRKELSDTVKKKEDVKKQGIALANLFDKYREREEQLRKIIEN